MNMQKNEVFFSLFSRKRCVAEFVLDSIEANK